MATKKIKGRIIRILDTRTVIINLGREDGIKSSSIFHILGEPEPVIDPMTEEILGRVTVEKTRVKASQVFEKFTIATTSWVEKTLTGPSLIANIFGQTLTIDEIDEGELLVRESDIQPWKAKTELPIQIGDEVEVSIERQEAKMDYYIICDNSYNEKVRFSDAEWEKLLQFIHTDQGFELPPTKLNEELRRANLEGRGLPKEEIEQIVTDEITKWEKRSILDKYHPKRGQMAIVSGEGAKEWLEILKSPPLVEYFGGKEKQQQDFITLCEKGWFGISYKPEEQA